MSNVLYGCCVGDWDKFRMWVIRRHGQQISALSGQTSIAVAYNRILETALSLDVDMLILQHDDLEITDPEGEGKLHQAVSQPGVMLAGVAGGGSAQGLAWWNVSPVGHQRINSGVLDFGPRAGHVDVLEGSLLAFSRLGIENLRFDEFPGFHSYDEIALQARAFGPNTVYVADVDTFHHTDLGFKSVESQREWLEGNARVCRKWNL